VDGIYRYVTV